MTVDDIKNAIEQLSKSEVSELSRWFEKFEEEFWDGGIAIDSAKGRFDHLQTYDSPRRSV